MEIEGIQEPNEENVIEQEAQSQEPESQPEPQEPEPQEEPAPYEPNFSYKYKDEELEFDERLRSGIKTKEDEDYVRDLVTAHKAHSAYKELGSIREVEERLGEWESRGTELNELTTEIDQLSGLLGLGNSAGFEAFRQHLGIDKKMVMKWASEEAQGMENPELAAQFNQQREMEAQNFHLQYQNQMMQNREEDQLVQQRTVELDTMLGSNEVAKAYDNLVGTPGSFQQAVIQHGAHVQSTTGQVLSMAEAIAQVSAKYQGLNANQVNSGTNNQVAQNPTVKSDPQQTVVIKQEGKTTIPNLSGTTGSPAKKQLNSLDALRAHEKTL